MGLPGDGECLITACSCDGFREPRAQDVSQDRWDRKGWRATAREVVEAARETAEAMDSMWGWLNVPAAVRDGFQNIALALHAHAEAVRAEMGHWSADAASRCIYASTHTVECAYVSGSKARPPRGAGVGGAMRKPVPVHGPCCRDYWWGTCYCWCHGPRR